jgi:ribosome recycling factor
MYEEIEEKMKKAISVLEEQLASVRAGRANPKILDKVLVDYYGVPTPINQVANIMVPEARMIAIQPWDASIIKDVEKAIQEANIGINPNNDGKVIRLVFPELTEERRKDLVKDIRKVAEEARVAVRSIRRDGMESAKEIAAEDEKKVFEDKIQKLTDKYIEEVDKMLENKEKEIMSI